LAFTLTVGMAPAAPESVPATLVLRGEDLVRPRVLAKANDPAVAAPLKKLRREAEKALAAPPVVVTEKKHPQPGFDPHDYVSLATYYWPDPAKSNGLPYIGRDGERNPETQDYDHAALKRMEHAVHHLAQAWFFTGEQKYAEGAARQLRAWFLDPATKMNPNLNHGQMVKGKDTGRATGIIDTHGLPVLLDDILLLRGAPGWSAGDERKLRDWCRDYLGWLRTSKLGQREANTTNNHATWYDAQCTALALFVGDRAQAKEILEQTKSRRIATQIEPDGRQPQELRRTLSISYTFFNLEALCTCARLGEHVGVDLWNFRTADGRGLRAALEWVLPYALQEKQWENKQIKGGSFGPLYGLLRRAAVGCREPAYEQKAAKLPATDDEKMWANFYCSPPTKK
jgi:hypothetical protein